jgi:hypothetical protein
VAGLAARTHAAPAVAFESRVEGLDPLEDVVGHGLLARAVGRRDPRVGDQLAVLHRHLRELALLPVAHPLRAVDRDGNDGRPALERDPADPGPHLIGQAAGARAPALAVHRDTAAALEDRVGGDERLVVAVAAPHGKDPAMAVDEVQRRLEQL